MDKTIKAGIIADSINQQGNRVTTYILTYPRIIHAELLTHRLFSRNAASSRAIPAKKMIKMIEEDPFIPIAWQKAHKGMQGTEYITDPELIKIERDEWLKDVNYELESAKKRIILYLIQKKFGNVLNLKKIIIKLYLNIGIKLNLLIQN